MTIPAVDPGPIRPSGDASLCWGDRCYRAPTPASGREVEGDPLGLCARCRAEIVGSPTRENVGEQVG